MVKNLQCYIVVFFTLLCFNRSIAQACNAAGNVFIFSNYDGSRETVAGRLNLVVNVNIPNIKIGICSYERVTVNITGAFAGNVTRVLYAGYNGTTNCNCYWPSTPAGCMVTSTITGVPAGIISYSYLPPATYSDPNGYNSIICAYQCAGGNQGGCNTPAQVVSYFMSAFGSGNTFNSHRTQYNCWAGATYSLSTSGNCCLTVLPIELESFSGKCLIRENESVSKLLNWTTTSENDNAYFSIEKSVNGLDWEELDQIKGQLNSHQKTSYSYKHVSDEDLYYRLKQVDANREFRYSDIVYLPSCNESKVELYPNPAEDKVVLKGKNIQQVDIFNLNGFPVFTKLIRSDSDLELDVSRLEKGIYFLKVKGKNFKLVKT
jgi:hypothetical protein